MRWKPVGTHDSVYSLITLPRYFSVVPFRLHWHILPPPNCVAEYPWIKQCNQHVGRELGDISASRFSLQYLAMWSVIEYNIIYSYRTYHFIHIIHIRCRFQTQRFYSLNLEAHDSIQWKINKGKRISPRLFSQLEKANSRFQQWHVMSLNSFGSWNSIQARKLVDGNDSAIDSSFSQKFLIMSQIQASQPQEQQFRCPQDDLG